MVSLRSDLAKVGPASRQYCLASSLLGQQQRFSSPSPPQKRRRGSGRGGRFSSVSPLSNSLPARSSRGERAKRPRRFSCRTLLASRLSLLLALIGGNLLAADSESTLTRWLNSQTHVQTWSA